MYFIQHCLHLPPLRFHWVGGCRDRNLGLLRLRHWQSDALTTRLDLVHYPLSNYHIGGTGLNEKKCKKSMSDPCRNLDPLAPGLPCSCRWCGPWWGWYGRPLRTGWTRRSRLPQSARRAGPQWTPTQSPQKRKKSTVRVTVFWILLSSAADPHHFDANPDRVFHFWCGCGSGSYISI